MNIEGKFYVTLWRHGWRRHHEKYIFWLAWLLVMWRNGKGRISMVVVDAFLPICSQDNCNHFHDVGCLLHIVMSSSLSPTSYLVVDVVCRPGYNCGEGNEGRTLGWTVSNNPQVTCPFVGMGVTKAPPDDLSFSDFSQAVSRWKQKWAEWTQITERPWYGHHFPTETHFVDAFMIRWPRQNRPFANTDWCPVKIHHGDLCTDQKHVLNTWYNVKFHDMTSHITECVSNIKWAQNVFS